MYKNTIFWFRNDLRLNDNCGLWHALKQSEKVLCVFIMDKNHTEGIGFNNKRQELILNAARQLKLLLKINGGDLIFLHNTPEDSIFSLSKAHQVEAVFCNEGYTPHMRKEEKNLQERLGKLNIKFHSFKDSAIFAKNDILNSKGEPYQNFSSYSTNWLKRLTPESYQFYDTTQLLGNLSSFKQAEIIHPIELKITNTNKSIQKIGASQAHAARLLELFVTKRIENYHLERNYPAKAGVSYLSVHLSAGIISIRHMLSMVMAYGDKNPASKDGCNAWINQLCWRDYYAQQLYHNPRCIYEPYNALFDTFEWNDNMKFFQKWCEGKTGYPIIDAAMRQLNQTGYMHNRLRMIVSSFLTKHLLIDYRLGEQYFQEKLLDLDVASNNGGWQWAASTGSEAQPFFRIFNPVTQSEKFDPEGHFIKRFIPELRLVDADYLHDPFKYRKELLSFGVRLGFDYPEPIVDNQAAKQKAIWKFEQHSRM